jgi:hypothetical protein
VTADPARPGPQLGRLQLDLASVIARIEQLNDMTHFDNGHWLWNRVTSCDLPRLRGHLSPEAEQLLERITESAPPE